MTEPTGTLKTVMIGATPMRCLKHCLLFYAGWGPAALAAQFHDVGAATRSPTGMLIISLAGFDVPLITAIVGALGVLLARPLAPKGANPIGRIQSACVAAICVLLVLAWIIESHPGLLFALIMAIGIGFSGFAIIELAGQEALAFIRRIGAALNPSKGDGSDA